MQKYKVRKDDNENAIILYSREIESQPNNPQPYFLRGTCNHTLRNYKIAIADYTKALELNSENKAFRFRTNNATFDNITILRNRSSAYREIGEKFLAEKDLENINQIMMRQT